jgi:hypothetical protein
MTPAGVARRQASSGNSERCAVVTDERFPAPATRFHDDEVEAHRQVRQVVALEQAISGLADARPLAIVDRLLGQAEIPATTPSDLDDDEGRRWPRVGPPEPVGYDPAIIPPWADGPTSEAFAVLHLQPYRLRVVPGTVLLGQGGEVLTWRGSSDRR